MSAFKQKLARLGATAGVLVATTAAFMAVSGVAAGSALAFETTRCQSVPAAVRALKGQGSTLQNVAQGEWTTVYNKECTAFNAESANFKYEGTGSGAALNAFGYNAGTTLNTEYAYVGTDEAPNTGQISTAEGHANSVAPAIIPVAQTAIAVVVNKPSVCTITNGITYADLNALFAGTIKHWTEISTMPAGSKAACTTAEGGAEITRVVRADGSGTTYQFKNYLQKLHTEFLANLVVPVEPGEVEVSVAPHKCETKSWGELRQGGGTPNLNLLWPESGCAGNGARTPVHPVSGGGALVEYVSSELHPNTIGYAAYSDVLAKKATANVISLQNKEVSGVKGFAKPGKGTGEKEANCGNRTYTVPPHANEGAGTAINWSETFGAVPQVATAYPLCTLTYDLAWNGYATAGYGSENGTNIAKAVKGYIGYLLHEGQTSLGNEGYAALPETKEEANNVKGAAIYAWEHGIS